MGLSFVIERRIGQLNGKGRAAAGPQESLAGNGPAHCWCLPSLVHGTLPSAMRLTSYSSHSWSRTDSRPSLVLKTAEKFFDFQHEIGAQEQGEADIPEGDEVSRQKRCPLQAL